MLTWSLEHYNSFVEQPDSLWLALNEVCAEVHRIPLLPPVVSRGAALCCARGRADVRPTIRLEVDRGGRVTRYCMAAGGSTCSKHSKVSNLGPNFILELSKLLLGLDCHTY